jgi:hypothetical protein
LDNKPYLAVDDSTGHVFITDPEGYRVVEFTNDGEIVRVWGDIGSDAVSFGITNGVVYDPISGGIWVADSGTGRLLHFMTSEPEE